MPTHEDPVFDRTLRDHGLRLVFGSDLAEITDPAWLAAIEEATIVESVGLLPVSTESASRAISDARVVIVYEETTRAFVACVFLHELVENWVELGTVYVVPHWRFGKTGVPISRILHHVALQIAENHGWDVSETSTVHAILEGVRDGRNGVVLADFNDLPPHVQKPTCCCPREKTGAPEGLEGDRLHAWNVTGCASRNTACRLMVSPATYARLLRDRSAQAAK